MTISTISPPQMMMITIISTLTTTATTSMRMPKRAAPHGTKAGQGESPAEHNAPPEGASGVRYRIDKMDCPTEESADPQSTGADAGDCPGLISICWIGN
jgi:hypothetical protein